MRLPIDGMQAFVQIAELGSFNRAAERMGLTQTAMTRRVQKLEAFVGAKLLDRTTRSTTLTPVGRQFLPLAKRLVDDLTDGLMRLRSASKLSIGDVRIATLQSIAFYRLPTILRAYGEKYPHNRVEILERSGSLVTDAVRHGHADFGIHIQQELQSDLEEEPLLRNPLVLVCADTHPLARRRKVAWAALKGIDLITLGGASGNRRIVEAELLKVNLEGRGRFTAESTPTAIALAAAGVGAAILPSSAGGGRSDGLREVPLVEPVITRAISLVRRRSETLTPAASALFGMIRKQLT